MRKKKENPLRKSFAFGLCLVAGTLITIWMLSQEVDYQPTPNLKTVDENYPSSVPQNFKEAPQQIFCQNDNWPAYAKFYKNVKESRWLIVILGKYQIDLYIYFQTFPEQEGPNTPEVAEWVRIEDIGRKEWIPLEKMSGLEQQIYRGGKFFFTKEEKSFFAECYKNNLNAIK